MVWVRGDQLAIKCSEVMSVPRVLDSLPWAFLPLPPRACPGVPLRALSAGSLLDSLSRSPSSLPAHPLSLLPDLPHGP